MRWPAMKIEPSNPSFAWTGSAAAAEQMANQLGR